MDADLVTGVPESGLTAAKGYAMEAGLPFEIAFYKNSYIGRTFIKPTQKERESSVKLKLNVLESVVKDKRIVLVDDSIVRGTTMANLIQMLKRQGQKRFMYASAPLRFCIHVITERMYRPMSSSLRRTIQQKKSVKLSVQIPSDT